MAKKVRKKKNNKLKKILLAFVIIIIIATGTGSYYFFDYVVSGLPSLEQLENPKTQLASNVYTSDGELLYQFFEENRIEADIDSIPKVLIDALIATEDLDFYKHWGVHVERTAKAVFKTIFMGRREGGSTITQQLVKNQYRLTKGERNIFDTIVRKFREWILSTQIEKAYTKNEILEMYLNTTFFGERAYGVSMAARNYFNKNVSELDILESALLVALCKSGVLYNPYKYYDRALQRRNLVLYNMAKNGFLKMEEYQKLKQKPITLSEVRHSEKFQESIAPHFVEYIRKKLEGMSDDYKFNILKDGLTIHTTIDSRIQKIANKVVKEHLDFFQKKFDRYWKWSEHEEVLNDLLDLAVKGRKGYWRFTDKEKRKEYARKLKSNKAFVDSVQKANQQIEVGFVAIDVKTGNILAMVGGRKMKNGRGWNHVTNLKRQPGSTFKPFVYLTAIDNGLYPAYPILNQKFITPDGWTPKNFSDTYGGFLTLREGLKYSKNIIAARLWLENYAPLYQIAQNAYKMGIKTKLRLVPSITLGTSEVNPLEMTSAYATIANKGIYNSPLAITEIDDKDGIIIETFAPASREALTEETAFLIADMMKSVINEGTGLRVRNYFSRPAIGKTGTSQQATDAWFIGATPQIAAGVWVGFDKDRRINFEVMGDIEGQASRAALPIWAKFMKEVYDSLDFDLEDFEVPASGDIQKVSFCEESIYTLGDPKLYSMDCKSGRIWDYINVKHAPQFFNSKRDTVIKIFDKYMWSDTLSQEAIEITEDDSLYYDEN